MSMNKKIKSENQFSNCPQILIWWASSVIVKEFLKHFGYDLRIALVF